MTKLVFDSCSLIYLAKINKLAILPLVSKELYIDNEVYNESVVSGKDQGYRDAFILDRFIEEYMKVVSLDISGEIDYFGSKGEASAFLLGKDGICITSDKKAFKKMQPRTQKVIKIEDLFYIYGVKGKIPLEQLRQVLKELLQIDAISFKKYSLLIKEVEEWEQSQLV